MRNLQVVVLLGGLGTRLRGVGSNIPKAMIDIYGKPFFYYQLKLMKNSGFRNFVFCIGYKGDKIKSFFKDGRKFGVDIKYSSDGDCLLGTAGAIRKAFPLLKNELILIYGDSFMDVDYIELIYAYYKTRSEQDKKGLLAVFKNKNRYDKSNVIFENGKLLKYDKKNPSPKMKYIDYGIAILQKDLLKNIPKNAYADLADVYRKLVGKRLIAGYEVRNRFYEIGRPSSLDEFKKFIHRRLFVKKKAIFLDRDGTLNEMTFNKDEGQLDSPLKPEYVKLLPKTIPALHILKSLGYLLIVVTNQPAAAKGKTRLGNLYEVNNRFKDIMAKNRIYLDDVLICPHHPRGSPYSKERFLIKKCECRKPKTGLLDMAIEKFNVDKSKSYMVGDSYRDIIAGQSLKLKSVFLRQHKSTARKLLKNQKPDYVFDNLYDLAVYLKNIAVHKNQILSVSIL